MTAPRDLAPASGRMTSSLLWVYGCGAFGMLLQIGGTAILARILAPQAFGEIAAAAAVLRVAQHVANMGMTTALTREAGRIEAAARALILFSVGLSLLLAGLLWICAPMLLWLQPEATGSVPVLRTLAFTLVLAAFGQAAAALLQSRLDFRHLGLAQLAAQVSGQFGVAIPLAMLGAGTWSLVCGSLMQAALLAGLVLMFARPGWRGPLTVPADLLRLGFRYMLLRLLDVSGQSIPPLAITAMLGLAVTGSFDRAFALSVMPLDWLATGLATVLFPIYARQAIQAENARLLLPSIALGGGVLLAVATGMLMARDHLVLAILGPQWLAAAPLLGWLAAWGFLRGLAVLNGSLVEARSSLRFRSWQQAGYIACLAGLLLLVRPSGADHIMMLLVAVEVVNVALLFWHAAHVAGIAPLPLLRSLLAVSYPGAAVAMSLVLVLPVAAAWPAAAALGLCITVSALVLAGSLYWHPAPALRSLVRSLLRRPA